MEWSRYQTEIFSEAGRRTQDSCSIIARAGAGKTTALVESLNHVPYSRTLLCAFNKAIQTELQSRVPRNVMTRTLHSLGLRVHQMNLAAHTGRKAEVDTDKARRQSLELMREKPRYWKRGSDADAYRRMREVALWVRKTASYAKNTLRTEPERLLEIAADQDLSDRDEAKLVAEAAGDLLRRAARDPYHIDFDDMVWMPARYGYGEVDGTEMLRFDAVMVDECLPYDSRVSLADGTFKPIGEIVDKFLYCDVVSYDLTKNQRVRGRVIGWHALPVPEILVRIRAGGMDLACTENHRVWTQRGWIRSEQLREGDGVQLVDGRFVPIESFAKIAPKERFVYDITVEHEHNYFAEGVLVHNCQDLNAAQYWLVDRLHRGGRLITVGDPRQAVYGFRGADREAYRRLIDASPVQLSLPISYRCPVSVIELAREVVPDIEPAPGAPDGTVTLHEYNDMLDEVAPGDFVLSRTNAPLIATLLKLVRRNVPTVITGRDFGKSLVSLVEKSKADDMPSLSRWLGGWFEKEQKRLLPEFPGRLERARDRCACLRELVSWCSTVPELIDKIEEMFDDTDMTSKVVCSTVHKAKGLERDCVWMLTDTFGYPEVKPWMDVWSEENIWYVAVTRAKKQLCRVETPVSEILGQAQSTRSVGQRRRSRSVQWR